MVFLQRDNLTVLFNTTVDLQSSNTLESAQVWRFYVLEIIGIPFCCPDIIFRWHNMSPSYLFVVYMTYDFILAIWEMRSRATTLGPAGKQSVCSVQCASEMSQAGGCLQCECVGHIFLAQTSAQAVPLIPAQCPSCVSTLHCVSATLIFRIFTLIFARATC